MKLAVSTYSLSRWMRDNNKSINQAIDWIADHVRGIEFVGIPVDKGQDPIRKARAIRRRCEQRRLKIVGYCTGANLLQTKPREQAKVINEVKQQVDVAAALGAPSMRHDVAHGFGDDWKGPRTDAAAFRILVPAVRQIADYADSRGVKTSLENHGFYLQSSARVDRFIQAVNHPNYGLTIDIGNFLCVAERPETAVPRLAKHAIMAHIKDFHIKPKTRAPDVGWIITPKSIAIRGAVVGHGDIDLLSCLKSLRRSGYDGWLSLEFEGLEEPAQGVELGLTYAERLIKSL
ncbi:MAG: sugar phosphate isomerase [Planctomycetaceae bacterium]|nr:sugar phosphate isomerase [Planctomycetaceae bacterium]